LGAKQVGASKQAVSGRDSGTVIGVIYWTTEVLLGPFVGAVLANSPPATALRSNAGGRGPWLG